jgi:hypothetical protein
MDFLHMWLKASLPAVPALPPSAEWVRVQDPAFVLDGLFEVPTNILANSSAKNLFSDGRADGVTGSWLYPPGGGQGWHTNTHFSPHRLYVSWSETGDSGMLFLKDGVVSEDRDERGWNIRLFDATQPHAVFARCWRYSVGMRPEITNKPLQ